MFVLSVSNGSFVTDQSGRGSSGDGQPDIQATSVHLGLGNPSGATADATHPDNYLIIHDSFALSYNNSRGTANWVAWRTRAADLGQKLGRPPFMPDQMLPAGFTRVQSADYTGSGYDRGHLVPSADRFGDARSNEETFQTTNIVPQTPELNQYPWEKLESYSRSNVRRGMDTYSVAGVYGDAGRIKGRITIPTNCWKVIVIVPAGLGYEKIDSTARVIAVDMPNVAGIAAANWRQYRTTVREIERRTGLDLLSSLPQDVQEKLETRIER